MFQWASLEVLPLWDFHVPAGHHTGGSGRHENHNEGVHYGHGCPQVFTSVYLPEVIKISGSFYVISRDILKNKL